ncbi:polymer-forming cytoskeletal protein [Methylovorus menthalis]|uniref:bactofilin family protein n=1 Tax=Methylovorus menthalis TaxID=1002227 RepID=UPI001E4EB9E1|nr:polymer-forming cytoskeletal protein [Methylovorus menthalis]MCB4811322.1 polymer-forming cytoskeletal protein [Methylovorus menthalis]
MLNKQGLFNRGAQPSPAQSTPSSRPATSPLSAGASTTTSAPYPASQPSAVASATAASTVADNKTGTENQEISGSRLIVGPDVKLKGAEIQDCDTLVVEGRVEATMDSRVIQIAEAGEFSGKVGIDVAEIYGKFEGELTARSQLIIHASGRVSGKIRYGKIFIEEGGELSGDIASISTDNTSHKASPLRAAASASQA